jgi:ATP-dependent DNA helicase DinG
MSAISSFFAEGGPLSKVLSEYRYRDGQREMARQIAFAIADGATILCDAATGTGKSMSYLIPVALSGKRAVVSTATKALQHQLAGKDLPTLVALVRRRLCLVQPKPVHASVTQELHRHPKLLP